MTALLVTYVSAAGTLVFIALMVCVGDETFEYIPKGLAVAVLWPLALIVVACIGVRQLVNEYIITGSKSSELSRKQRRNIAYETAQIDIKRKQNDETERAMSIIRGE